jgi:hypothetical protein
MCLDEEDESYPSPVLFTKILHLFSGHCGSVFIVPSGHYELGARWSGPPLRSQVQRIKGATGLHKPSDLPTWLQGLRRYF